MPPFTAFAQALNWISQLRCIAALLLTNVLPLTSNGLVESPESVTGGAVIPPSAAASLVAVDLAAAAEVVVDAAEGSENEAELASKPAAAAREVEAGAEVEDAVGSTVMVFVT